MGRRFEPWQDIFKIFTISMYKCYFEKPNIDFHKKHLSANSRISILLIQISNVHMGIAPGPASQDAVLKLKYALPGLQCCLWGADLWDIVELGELISTCGRGR